ncbi:hypothetical protein, partial [uncultured Rikenella sp.]|uniref:hypothetical protein n=1 Tax=uncultured Rikenella sp. TaxID=368003 RepID=UPI00260C7C07
SLKRKNQRNFQIAALLLTLRSPLALSFLWGVAIAGIKRYLPKCPLLLTPQENQRQGHPAGSRDALASQKVFLVLFVHKENSTLKHRVMINRTVKSNK